MPLFLREPRTHNPVLVESELLEQVRRSGEHIAAIALGSNLAGDKSSPRANLQGAVEALASLGSVLAVSSWIETTPIGYTDQPNFFNGAALLQTRLAPVPLLDVLLRLEREFGRDRSHGIAKGPRTLDLDLLLYDDVVLRTDELTLPHPELHRRRFVLQPLAEIAPGLQHPTLRRTAQQLLDELSAA